MDSWSLDLNDSREGEVISLYSPRSIEKPIDRNVFVGNGILQPNSHF
jgi:hypothetical protein